jgi:hypothetical protein
MKRFVIVTAALAVMIAASACGADRRDGPQGYKVSVDALSPAEKTSSTHPSFRPRYG